mgnify:CR=1 FL=1|jgi:thymidylate synthase
MQEYLDLITDVLTTGQYKPNRTGVDTISGFSMQYDIDLTTGFPLLTTKNLSGGRWNSLLHELVWYLSGKEHIRELRKETGIWDAWADTEGHLDTAYGRFWRRYPIPAAEAQLPGESWAESECEWVTSEGVFDQLRYVIDTLQESPHSRRMVVNAWHPANAAVSTLPPCHYSYVFSVQGDKLNVHLTQRSGDIALGIPFNIAAYALLAHVVAGQTAFTPGRFAHTIVDGHIYCGKGDRGRWYADHLDELSARVAAVTDRAEYADIAEWVRTAAPQHHAHTEAKPLDHVPGLLKQCSRFPQSRPSIDIADVGIDELSVEDISLSGYNPAPAIEFGVAE